MYCGSIITSIIENKQIHGTIGLALRVLSIRKGLKFFKIFSILKRQHIIVAFHIKNKAPAKGQCNDSLTLNQWTEIFQHLSLHIKWLLQKSPSDLSLMKIMNIILKIELSQASLISSKIYSKFIFYLVFLQFNALFGFLFEVYFHNFFLITR